MLNHPTSEEETVLFESIEPRLAQDPTWYSRRIKHIKGVSEETTTGVKRLYQMAKEGRLAFPAINVNDRSPSRSSITSTAAASHWWTVSSVPLT